MKNSKFNQLFYHLISLPKGISSNYIPLHWFNARVNFGDHLNLYLINKLTNRKPFWINPNYWPTENYLMIGSLAQKANRSSIIWGSGFVSQDSKVTTPKKIISVRGPKTRQKFLDNNIDCPQIYGDPALLMPKLYTPSYSTSFKLGVIAHYVDKDLPIIKEISQHPSIKIIDIENPNIEDFIENLNECELIVSSSLHGLILSDAYRKPSIWVQFSSNVKGDGFKFFDYFSSVDREPFPPINIRNKDDIISLIKPKDFTPISFDPDRYIKTFPL